MSLSSQGTSFQRAGAGAGETGVLIGPHAPVVTATPACGTSLVAEPPVPPGGAVPAFSGPHPRAPCPAHGLCLPPPTAEPRIRGNSSHGTDEPLRVTAKAGDEVTLDCEAQGSPPPLVTWIKDSRPVPLVTDR